MMFKEPLTYIVAYILVGIFTFGHAWVNVPETETGYFAGDAYTIHNGSGTKLMVAVGSAAFSPLYWSVRLQK